MLVTLSLLSGACAEPTPLQPNSIELTSESTTPLTEVTFLVTPPPGTSSNTDIAMLFVDTIAGGEITNDQIPLTRRNDGRYASTITVPVGSLLTYRYIRTSQAGAMEVFTTSEAVAYRVNYVPGPSQIEETIAGWSDVPAEGGTGRILGRIVNQETKEGQRELLVSAGGRTVFSEADGYFRIDGLPEGVHQLTVFSPNGAYLPNSQGAIVASGMTTPAELAVQAADPIFVTFQLTVPEGLSPDAVVRLAGNISTIGNRFNDLAGGTRVSVEHMPTLVRVDPQHFLAVISLYAGTDLRYKYTLGDGFWNAERDAEGSLVTRQVILPDQDVILRDTLTAWGGPGLQPVRFMLQVPEHTPENEWISLQFKLDQWFDPLPMWPLTQNSWYFDLYGPLEKDLTLQYRYCRNAHCGAADDADTAGLDASGRAFAYAEQAEIITDEVLAWQWLEQAPSPASITAEPAAPRPEIITGVEIAPNYPSAWRRSLSQGVDHLQSLGVESIILPLRWEWGQQNPFPILGLNPGRNPLQSEVRQLTQIFREAEIDLMLRISPSSTDQTLSSWWASAVRDPAWWQLWFEEYRLFALSSAELAQELGIDVLILGGRETRPALPDGTQFSGEPSMVPLDAEVRWRALIDDLRAVYTGQIIYELELVSDIPEMPSFLDSVDGILFHWQIPASGGASEDASAIAKGYVPFLDLIDARTGLFNRPVWLSIEYASVQGGATSCPPAPDGSCRSIESFASGQDIDPDLPVSFEEQTKAINSVLLAAYDRAFIQGFFIRGYDPSAILWDKSSSIYGKPAEEVLRYWYPRLNGTE